ncbi:hypothetical protein [Litorihabitans aurantiacus]|uniref:Uncharacterized protein n=1 Tax=Litorihabitans aurantiacus TaxID=1930061 RepID=A0AA37XCY1_9MICO|nr:hypothetical protein [Litorihabitans aurantiacus]GMA30343.1 hypothetical protein GCM10025875_03350 [Litorihabitans aurantiacus]
MAQDDYDYPEDEFDALGAQRAPAAVHRAPRPWWRVWGPLIAVVVLAPAVAFGLVQLATGGDTEAPPAASPGADDGESAPPEEGGDGESAPPEEGTEGEGGESAPPRRPHPRSRRRRRSTRASRCAC